MDLAQRMSERYSLDWTKALGDCVPHIEDVGLKGFKVKLGSGMEATMKPRTLMHK